MADTHMTDDLPKAVSRRNFIKGVIATGGNICYADTPTAMNREHAIFGTDRQRILTHISWNLLWASLVVGVYTRNQKRSSRIHRFVSRACNYSSS
jgi:hypothetical protein